MANDTNEMLKTIDEACKFIRASRNRTIFISVSQRAPIEGDEERAFPVYGHIKVSAPVACAFVQDAYKHFEERGGRVRISLNGTCMFIG